MKRWLDVASNSIERALAAALLASSLVSVASNALGTEPSRLNIVVVTETQVEPSLANRISSWFDPALQPRVSWTNELRRSAVLDAARSNEISVWVVLKAHRARVYLRASRNSSKTRYLFQDLELASGLDEVGSERLSQLLHSATMALWEDEQRSQWSAFERELSRDAENERAVANAQPVTKAPLKRPTAAARPRGAPKANRASRDASTPVTPTWRWGAEYRASYADDEEDQHALGIAARWLPFAGAGIGTNAHYLIPSSFAAAPVVVQLSGFDVEAVAEAALPVASAFAANLGLIAGAQRLTWSVQSQARSETELRPYFGPMVGLRWGDAPGLLLSAEFRVFPMDTRYTAIQGSRTTVVAASPSVQPALRAQIFFEL
jgi:hypothetical protein